MQSITYRGRTYRSRCSLARKLLHEGYKQSVVASETGLTPQTVCRLVQLTVAGGSLNKRVQSKLMKKAIVVNDKKCARRYKLKAKQKQIKKIFK